MHKILRISSLLAYYVFARYLPDSYTPIIGGLCNKIRLPSVDISSNIVAKYLLSIVWLSSAMDQKWRLET